MPELRKTLSDVILDPKESGSFELDAEGHTRFVPTDEKLAELNRWIGDELVRAAEEHAPLFALAADNIEAFSLTQKSLPGPNGQPALLPSALARNPSDKKIATTVNNVLRAPTIYSFDAYFDAQYDVAVPVKVGDVAAAGQPLTSPDGMPLDPDAEITIPLKIDAEVMARRFTQKVEFVCREQMNFAKHFHQLVQGCVSGAKPATYWLVSWESAPRTVIVPKVDRVVVADEQEERYERKGRPVWKILPFHNVLRPNLDDDINELEWIARRDPKKPDTITAGFENGDYPLIKDEEHAKKLAANVIREQARGADTKERLDASTKRYRQLSPPNECDVWYVSFFAWLKVENPDTGKKETRRYSLEGSYHLGAKQFLNIIRNPYDHQKRDIVAFNEYLDGMSTTELVKRNQQVDTHLTHAEIMAAYKAAHMHPWYNPDDPRATAFFGGMSSPIPPDFPIPVAKESWGFERDSSQHYSLLPQIQWNTGLAQGAAKSSEYEQGERVVSHTSPDTVGMMLERGGEEQRLFLRLLNDGMSEVMRLTLETMKQYEPPGGEVPIQDPKTRAITMVPFFYPVEDVLANFRITLTAADESTSRERSQQERDRRLQNFMQFTTFVANVAKPLFSDDPNITPEDKEFFRQVIRGGQALWDEEIAASRVDEKNFSFSETIDVAVEARKRRAAMMQSTPAAQQAAIAQLTGQPNAPANQAPNPGGPPPGAQPPGPNPGGPPGAGVEPGMAVGGMGAMGGRMPGPM